MGLFSFFRKNKQESASGQGDFLSRSEQSSVIRNRSSRSSANTSGRSASGGSRAKAKEQGADPLLPEKKRARRRLIGAVALALAVVIVLPMVLDSEPKPLNEDIAIQIPSKDQPAGSASPVAATAVDSSKQASAAAALDQKEEIIEPSKLNAPQSAPVASAASVMPPMASVAPAAKPVEKPAEKAPEKPAAKPAEHKPEVKKETQKETPKETARKDVKEAAKPKAADHPDDSARAMAILEGKSNAANADKKPAASGGKFVIQVAALATQEKVNELRNKLSGAGIHSFTQKVATQSGDRTRIRVGPFASREEADRMRARISKLGLNATIVPA